MDLKSALHNELINLVRNKNSQQDSASSFDSSDNDSLQISTLKIEDYSSKVTEKKRFAESNKFTDLISPNENNVEKLETTCHPNEYEDTTSNHSSSQSPKLIEDNYNHDLEDNSCSSIDSLNQLSQTNTQKQFNENNVSKEIESEDVYVSLPQKKVSNALIKRTHLKNLIYELYDLNEPTTKFEPPKTNIEPKILIEGVMEKLPPGKNLKNSVLLAWKRRYFKLSSIGLLNVFELNSMNEAVCLSDEPIEVYNLMGAQVTYEQNRVISLDDCRGSCVVFRCYNDQDNSGFKAWKKEIDSQIVDRSETLWVRPNVSLNTIRSASSMPQKNVSNKKVLIIDIGTSSIRAGFFSNEPKLPTLFVPTVCARDFTQLGNKFRVGFEAFDSVLASTAPSTIDLNKAQSMWSLNSTTSISGAGPNHLIFPLKNKKAIDKLSMDIASIDAILEYVVESLNVTCYDHQVVIITPQKFSDRVNVQFLNLLLVNEKYQFETATLMNQTLMSLYSYNSSVGIIANLGEKIDIVPICNGVSFQSGVTNLAYGGSAMSEYLNSYISRGHQNYVNDMEQYYVRYLKEKSCYAAKNYKEEMIKNQAVQFKLELKDQVNDFKEVEFPETARFDSVEGLFNPEIWGIDGQGIHKLIHKAIQSSSMDLRREMARSIYLCGGMSRIPGLADRLEHELKQLLPPTITVKVNCSDYSYHSAFLGAYRFIQQPEYQSLFISRDEWSNENVNCLRKWRMI